MKGQINIMFDCSKTVGKEDMDKQQETRRYFKGRGRTQTLICNSAVSQSNSTPKKQVSSPGGRLCNYLMLNPPEDGLSM